MEGTENADDPRRDPSSGTDEPGDLNAPVFRHPSEIGAMLAAANGIPAPPTRNSHPVGLISLGASLALIAVLIVSLSSPGPDSDTLTSSTKQDSVAIGQIAMASTTVAPTSTSLPLNTQDGVMRIERWGGRAKAQGNGVMIFDDGYIATSRELVAGATQLVVTAPDGAKYDARIVGADYILNIAVLQIDLSKPGEQPVAEIADSGADRGDTVHVADTWSTPDGGTAVLATDKVVADNSGFHRQELLEFGGLLGDGSAGAPLIDDDGKVVAMVLPVNDSSPNNFALDISAARLASHQLIESGFVKHVAWIGIKGASQPKGSGVRVDGVVKDSPADAAGIKVGDVIVTLARYNVSDIDGLHSTLDNLASRQVTSVMLMRGDKTIEAEITLGVRAQIR